MIDNDDLGRELAKCEEFTSAVLLLYRAFCELNDRTKMLDKTLLHPFWDEQGFVCDNCGMPFGAGQYGPMIELGGKRTHYFKDQCITALRARIEKLEGGYHPAPIMAYRYMDNLQKASFLMHYFGINWTRYKDVIDEVENKASRT